MTEKNKTDTFVTRWQCEYCGKTDTFVDVRAYTVGYKNLKKICKCSGKPTRTIACELVKSGIPEKINHEIEIKIDKTITLAHACQIGFAFLTIQDGLLKVLHTESYPGTESGHVLYLIPCGKYAPLRCSRKDREKLEGYLRCYHHLNVDLDQVLTDDQKLEELLGKPEEVAN